MSRTPFLTDNRLWELKAGENQPNDQYSQLRTPITEGFFMPEEGQVPLEVLEELENSEPQCQERPWHPDLAEAILVADLTGREIDQDGYYVDPPKEFEYPEIPLAEFPVAGDKSIRFIRRKK